MQDGETGFCGVRGVEAGEFISPALGRFCSLAVDPVEKKPFRHWRAGDFILSLGSIGCTMHCPFCQNHAIAHPTAPVSLQSISPEELLQKARSLGLQAVAYTYNEPTLQAEHIAEAAPLLKEAAIDTALVTNGFFSSESLEILAPLITAANVDVKAFNEKSYAAMGGSLKAVQKNIAALLEAGVHVELTSLIVPGLSDDINEFASIVTWASGLSREIPLHISRYFPRHTYSAPPTDLGLMEKFKKLASDQLSNVYLGNV